MDDALYDLRDLTERAGVTPRTVYFYVQQGLLPPAGSPGPGARYGEEHLLRLKVIRRLKDRHLPLAEIRKRLADLGPGDLAGLLEETGARGSGPRPSTALDYIRSVLAEETGSDSARRPPASCATPELHGASPSTERSQWNRILLAPDVELHVRRPLSREMNRRVDRVIAAARNILKEGECT
jgi:DNA-binding transcriptional MerR regulator